MNIANTLTASRLILAPFFFLFYYFPIWTGYFPRVSVVLLWLVFAAIETTDILDGHYARSRNQVTDLGKVLDPFADIMSRLTYFVCFAGTGVMPVWMFVIIMYREFGISFLRSLFLRSGVALAARRGGKTKAIAYSVSGGAGLLILTLDRCHFWQQELHLIRILALVIFGIAVLFSVLSMGDYLGYYFRHRRMENGNKNQPDRSMNHGGKSGVEDNLK
ncbi:MAG TPA: CDP-diacylglycerol--glycerol-3-phosphate 3-phosphatidyltransferase [Spirochaetia bacterium]|nr:CDP-diacylglycerol--glycerol-3-phosphate 3-phosphatidyltransferase [Spirochaetia bacterium]